MSGLKLSVKSGCTKPMKRRKNAGNQGNKLRPDNNCSRKDSLASAKAAHTVHFFGESVVWSLIENDFRRCKQNKVVRVYCVIQVYCICIIENVSSHTVLTR